MAASPQTGKVRPDATDGRVKRHTLWLDCDPGHDDAFAIILAGHSPRLRLLGISTVAGNQTVEQANALSVVTAAGIDTGVYKGSSKPLMRPPRHCPEIHGDSGLDLPQGVQMPPSTKTVQPGKAVLHMYSHIMEAYRQGGRQARVRIVATGALTNVALLITLYPEVLDRTEVVLMGGALGVGNTGPVQEFNIQSDPEAAKIVFDSGMPVTMIPLEVTHQCIVTAPVLDQLLGPADSRSSFCKLLEQLLLFFAGRYKQVFKFPHPPLHDPAAVAYVIQPDLFEVEKMRVDVETGSSLSAGQTVVDVWRQSNKEPNVFVAKSLDVPAFWQLLQDAILAADGRSKMD